MKLSQYIQFIQEQGKFEIYRKILDFFRDNPSPSDVEVHDFAEKLGIDESKLEEYIYMIMGSIFGSGRSKDFTGTYDPKELAMGIKVEMEHTTNPIIAERIAKDHLAEVPDYYTRLKKMEAEAGITEMMSKIPIDTEISGPPKDLEILRASIIAEFDAVNLYEQFSEETENSKIRKVLLDIAKEEKVHIGEFQAVLKELDSEHSSSEEEGRKEVEEMV